jgi:CARDB protein
VKATGGRTSIRAVLIVAVAAIVLFEAPLAGAAPPGVGGVGVTVGVSPLGVTLNLSPEQTTVGRAVRAKASVTNLGPTTITEVSVALRVDRTGLVVSGPASSTIDRLRPGQTASVTWSICGQVAGQYIVLARASHGGVDVESLARLLRITDGGRRVCP